jgi:membrane protease YdiL (CAAX protease family)
MKTRSLLCAILCFFFYFAQAILYSLFMGTFNMTAEIATIISNLISLLLTVFLIRNKKRAEYFGLCMLKIDGSMVFSLPLLIIPMVNLLYILLQKYPIEQNIFMLIFISIYIGIMEELIFRGFLFRAVEEHLNAKWAVIVSSIVFGLYHLVNLTTMSMELVIIQVIYSTAIGFSFAVVFYISKSLLPCIIIHSLTDIMAFIFAYDVRFEYETIGMVIIIIIAVLYGIIYVKKIKKSEIGINANGT